MTFHLNKSQLLVAEEASWRLTVETEDGVEITLPTLEDSIGEFDVRDVRDDPVQTVDGRRRWTRTGTINALTPGEHDLAVPAVRFTDRRHATSGDDGNDGGVVEGEISVDPLTVTINSVLDADADPTQFRDVKELAEVPLPLGYRWLLWSGGVVAASALIIGTALYMRRHLRRRAEKVHVPPPHEWALQQLDRLAGERLAEKGMIDEFYVRLSTIVRVYVELRFGLMAPDRTTEEFLVETQRGSALSSPHKALLSEFLQACDLVKFARYLPPATEVDQALSAARTFVQETVPVAGPIQTMEAAA